MKTKTKDQENASEDLRHGLRELAECLLRISAGAGDPARLGGYLGEATRSFDAYHRAFGHWPQAWVISEHLSLERENGKRPETFTREQWRKILEERHLNYLILQGALRVAAGELVHNPSQHTKAYGEMISATKDLLALWKRQREQMGWNSVA